MEAKTRRAVWIVRLRRVAAVAFFVYLFSGPRLADSRLTAAVWAVAIPVMIVAAVYEIRRDRRSYRALKAVRSGGRWPLGEPYPLALAIDDDLRHEVVLTIGESALEFRAGSSPHIAFEEVLAVRVRATHVEIETPSAHVRLHPRSYADRERLLWELAVRCNAAVERGIDETKPTASSRDPAPAPSLVDYEPGATGLASALAGPDLARNPAPPRKSGLGVGLFVPPPDEPPCDGD